MAARSSFEGSSVPHLNQHPESPSDELDPGHKHGPGSQEGKDYQPNVEGERGTNQFKVDGFWEPPVGTFQDDGVTKIEALYLVFGRGWGLFALWGSIGLISYAYALSQSTTWHYTPFATSAFGAHSLVGLISVITSIMSGVAQPFIGKIADIFSRPVALTVSVAFYAVGYAMTAGANNIETVAAGQVIYTLGNTGINYLNGLIIADITSLEWRGAIQGAVTLPFVLNAFIAGYIANGVNAYGLDATGIQNGWRWGYGMFCIIIPVLISPAVIVLLIGDRRAKKLGALSLASPTYYRQQVIAGQDPVTRPGLLQTTVYYWRRLNGFGLLLLGFAFACLLSPMTLQAKAKGGWQNPSMIALVVVGGLLFIAWGVWDGYFASYPIMPRRVLNRTFLACVCIDFMYYFSGYLADVYFDSFVFIVTDFDTKDYTYFTNILTVGLCFFAFLAGLAQRYFHRYKYQQLAGLSIRILAFGIQYQAVKTPTTALLVTARVLVSLGGGMTVIASQVAAQASVPHQDLAISVAVLALWTQLGGSVASAISASVWNQRVPAKLEQYLGDYYNATARAEIFADITVARAAEPRDLAIKAYSEAFAPLNLAGLITAVVALGAGFFASNFYLGNQHNAIEEGKKIKFRSKEETTDEAIRERVRAVQEKVEAEVAAERQHM